MHVNPQLPCQNLNPKNPSDCHSYPQQLFSLWYMTEFKLRVKLEITQQLRDNEILCCTVILVIQLRNQRIISAV